MKNTMKILGIITLVAVIIFSAAACSGKGDKAATDAEVSVATSIGLDELIDEYEVIVDEFVAALQKVMDGDVEAAVEMEEIEAKLEAIYEQMAPYEDEATEEQIQRISDISEKLGFGF